LHAAITRDDLKIDLLIRSAAHHQMNTMRTVLSTRRRSQKDNIFPSGKSSANRCCWNFRSGRQEGL
jgi:hypothetical protein